MPSLFGGLWLENVILQDKFFDFQSQLLQEGAIKGVQIRVAHPVFTVEARMSWILANLPADCGLLFHLGAENVGVDLGENLDECGVFRARGQGQNWDYWNMETIFWGLSISKAAKRSLGTVLHPGYGLSAVDNAARNRCVTKLREIDSGSNVFLENVPPLVGKRFFPNNVHWGRDQLWGMGGTPSDMERLLRRAGPEWRCLIDFTHLVVLTTQANRTGADALVACRDLGKNIEAYLNLPHVPMCHFSGVPRGLVDKHTDLDEPIPGPIVEAMKDMDVICLEIQWNPKSSRRTIDNFVKRFKL